MKKSVIVNDKKIIIVTGLSGAGRTTALKVFEDLGYEAVDNLPFSLLPRIISKGLNGYFAVGIDIRSRDFDGIKISKFINSNKKIININLIYFDCEIDTLIDRFKESRRPHPLKLDIPIKDIIEQERLWLNPLKENADHVIDTSHLSIPNLGKIISSYFSVDLENKLNLRILSFGYKYGIPREADIVIDMRFIKNPFYLKDLKKLNGRDEGVVKYIMSQRKFSEFYKNFLNLYKIMIPMFLDEGKKYLTIAFGCTGGIHRSVMMAEKFSEEIFSKEIDVFLEHRDLKK